MRPVFAVSVAALVALGGAVLSAGCEAAVGTRCYDGEYLGCACGPGLTGYAKCTAGTYAACECTGRTPGVDAGPDTGGAGDAGPDSGPCTEGCAFGSPCEGPAGCASGVCASFAQQGNKCSQRCQADGDCPAESGKCGGQKVCKVP
jgi:hypothetical protein